MMSRALQAVSLALLLAAAHPACAQQNTLKITSQPGSAQVYLDDAPKGTTSPDEGKLILENLPIGSHKLRIGLSGYTDWIQGVTLTDGSSIYIDAKLTVAGPLPFTSQDVVDLLKGGVSPRRAADLVKERGVDFALTESIERDIRAAGGDADLLLAVTRAKAPPPPSPPPAVPPTITLLEPAGAERGKVIEVSGPTFQVRGTVSHPGGIASVWVNGHPVSLKGLTSQTAEFDLGDLPLISGQNAFDLRAIATDHSEVNLTLKVRRPDVREAILRGQRLVTEGDLAGAQREYQKALEVNKDSSLAHYRIAEILFLQGNYQAAAGAYREASVGDHEPSWTEVWSHIQLGKIFDLVGQRERAINEYQKALNTNDSTQGALDEARKYLTEPYSRALVGHPPSEKKKAVAKPR